MIEMGSKPKINIELKHFLKRNSVIAFDDSAAAAAVCKAWNGSTFDIAAPIQLPYQLQTYKPPKNYISIRLAEPLGKTLDLKTSVPHIMLYAQKAISHA